MTTPSRVRRGADTAKRSIHFFRIDGGAEDSGVPIAVDLRPALQKLGGLPFRNVEDGGRYGTSGDADQCAWIDEVDQICKIRFANVRRNALPQAEVGGELTHLDLDADAGICEVSFELSERYLEQHADLAYAGNVHVAQGRTVDTAHLVIDDTAGRESLFVGMSRGRERNTAYVVTKYARAAVLSPKLRPAPDIRDPAEEERDRKHPNRLAVLAAVLEREQSERTATETIRRELDRAASLATLAPTWADITRSHATRRYDNTIRSLLAAEKWQRYKEDPERGTLERLLRAAELAGHDTGGVLHTVIEGRDFAGARSIAAVLHGRVQRIVGTPEPCPAASYTDWTPPIDDPDADRFARDLATAMDERAALLGDRVALDRPAWALRYLGEVPADPIERAEWVHRAATAAAYREERGYTHDTDAIGPAPERGSPEQRASWHAAYIALRMPEEYREVATATDGELWTRRAAYSRETTWAPPYVAGELRDAHIAEDSYRADAVRAWHRADAATDEAEQAQARREAEEYGALAQEVGAHREALTEIAETRRRWHAATKLDRQRALDADTELRRRHPDSELPSLHPDAEATADSGSTQQASAATVAYQLSAHDDAADRRSDAEMQQRNPEPDACQAERDPSVSGLQGTRLDITAALEVARRAKTIIAGRERQASRDARNSDDDLMRRRQAEAEHVAASRRTAVRQDPEPSHQPAVLERDEPELEAGQ